MTRTLLRISRIIIPGLAISTGMLSLDAATTQQESVQSSTENFPFSKTEVQPWRAVQRRAHETVWQSVDVVPTRPRPMWSFAPIP